MLKHLSLGICALAVCSLLALGCGGEYEKQLGLAKTAKCELAGIRKKLDADRDNMELKEEYLRTERRIKIHLELSGNEVKGAEALKAHACP